MPISERNKQFIIVGITIAIVAVGIWLGYDQYGRVAAAQQQVNKSQTALSEEKQELDNLVKLNQSLQQMSVEMDSVRQVLPQGIAVPELLTNLEAIAVHSEVTLNSVAVETETAIAKNVSSQEEKVAPSGVKSLPVRVSITGNYNNVKKFLSDLEMNMRLLDVNSISSVGEGIFEIALTAYYVE